MAESKRVSTAEAAIDAAGISRLLDKELASAFAELGRFNLAIFGKTGSGKSTLLNRVFGSNVAPTGIGQSVTKGLNYYGHPQGFLGIYDSEGFETGTSGDAILGGLQKIVSEQSAAPVSERIHATWYVVRFSDRRFEKSQETFVRHIVQLGLPTIVVMSQVPARWDQGQLVIHPEAIEFARYIESLSLPTHPNGRVILSNSLQDDFISSEIFGLTEILDATFEIVPEAVRNALTAAQQVDTSRKKDAAAAVIKQATVVASGIGAIPIPIADAALLVPNQVAMIARITAIYGLPPSRARLLSIAGSAALTGGATYAGRYAVTTMLRLVPGGNVVGSAISGTVAATLTRSIGYAWLKVCEYAVALDGDSQDQFLAGSRVGEMFTSFLRTPQSKS